MTSADLARALRATRPVAPEALRSRVQTITTTEPPRRPAFGARLASLRPPRRRTLVALVPAAAVLVAVGAGAMQLVQASPPAANVAAAPGETSLESTRRAEKSATPSLEQAGSATDEAAPTASSPPSGGVAGSALADPALPSPAPDRAQRTSATLVLEVADTDALSSATQRAIASTRALGGYVVTVSYGTSETGAASLVVKVPSDRVQDALARLTALGTITSQNVQIDDLQGTLDATNQRIAVLRNRIAAISAKLDASLSSEERLRLEATRQNLRDELAGNRQSVKAVRGEAAFATIQLELRTKSAEAVVPVAPSRIDRAVDDAVEILAVEGIVLVYAAVVLVPLALVGLMLWAALRGLGRRGRDRVLEAN